MAPGPVSHTSMGVARDISRGGGFEPRGLWRRHRMEADGREDRQRKAKTGKLQRKAGKTAERKLNRTSQKESWKGELER